MAPVDPTPPWPSNVAPQPGMGGPKQIDADTSFRFSLRSPGTAINLDTLQTALGYGATTYVPNDDLLLPEQNLVSESHEVAIEGFDDWSGPTATEVADRQVVPVAPADPRAGTHYLEMAKPTPSQGRSFYVSSEVLSYRDGFQAEFLLNQYPTLGSQCGGPRPYLNEASYAGLMVGAVHGPSNRGIFVFFCDDDPFAPLPVPATQHILVTGPALDGAGNRQILADVAYQWWDPDLAPPASGGYTGTLAIKISWNLSPGRNVAEVVAGYPHLLPVYPGEVLASVDYRTIATFGGGARFGGHVVSQTERAFTVFGTEAVGPAAGRATLQSMGLFPLARDSLSNGVEHANALATVHPTDMVRMVVTEDPREADISPWMDGMLTGSVVAGSTDLTIRKETGDDPLLPAVLMRTEPLLADSWRIFVRLLARDTYFPNSNSSGMGLAVTDGTRVFHLALLSDFTDHFLGLLLGDPALGSVDPKMESFYERLDDTDWDSEVTLQLIAHGVTNMLDIYLGDEDVTPVVSLPIDATTWPTATAREPGISAGHVYPQYAPNGSYGDLVLRELWYMDGLDGYESRWGMLPNAAATPWTWMVAPVGSASSWIADDELFIDSDKGIGLYARGFAEVQPAFGVVLEWKYRVELWEDQIGSPNPTGEPIYAGAVYDNLDSMVFLAATLNANGQYLLYIPGADQEATLSAVLQQSTAGKSRSTEVDWREEHTYRLEFKPYNWVRLYVDNGQLPSIDLPWEDRDLPLGGVLGVVPTLGFGKWDALRRARIGLKFVRFNISTGYDLAVRRRMSQEEMDSVYSGGVNVFVEVADFY